LKVACGHGGNSAEQESVADLLSRRKYVFRSHVFVPSFQSAESVEMIENNPHISKEFAFLIHKPSPCHAVPLSLGVALHSSTSYS
jgi:hypothetical protein